MLSVRRLTGTFRGTSGSGGQDEDKILGILTLWLVEVSYMSSSAMWLALYMPFWLIIVEYIPFRVVLLNVEEVWVVSSVCSDLNTNEHMC